jgi:hypothetical protein
MADRYWVGGTGSWNSTSKWSTTSGGASGASVPTATDNAIFDANSSTSNAYVVTIQASQTCADLTYTPFAGDGVTQFSIIGTFVIAGTFSTSGTQGNRRAWLRSSTESLMRDVSIATIGTVTDVDFRDIRITGAGGTLTGTRIGDLKGNVGITFSTPKNCYRIGTGNWSDDQWSDTSGGAASTDNFPLAQDTAVFDESTSAGTHTMNSNAILYTGAVDMSARTSALTLSLSAGYAVYGNWTFGSGITATGAQTLAFSGRNTQVITSAGKTFSGSISVNSFGGTVELADALNIVGQTLTVTNGTFDTKGYSVTAGSLQSSSSSNSNVREIKLGASTLTLSGDVTFTTSTNLTFDAGTSSITLASNASVISGGNQTFYNASFSSTGNSTHTINQSNTFNNLSITAPASAGLRQVALTADQTITGTLTAAGATAVRRVMLRSSAVGTTRTLTVGTLSADDCDFRDITIVTNPALATASYDSVSFSVAGQETSPEALFFKPDGAKMYVLGVTGDDVNEYDLSIAWDISTASYVQNFSVAAEESGPSGLFFKPDGTKMYVTGFDGDDVNEYDLSSAWDISTASYLQNFSVSSQVVTPRGLFFKPDGTRMYTSGTTNDAIFEYLLSAAWDISTASYIQSFSVVTQDNAPEDLFFNPDGTKMYVVGDQANRVYEYDLSTSWDISTASYNSVSFGVGTQETNPNDVFFKSDGSKMYVVGSGTDAVYQYSTAPVPTNAGDCGGNSGVTFPAPKTVYWNFSGTRSWDANGWATTSGGTPDAANFPLAQDTAVFDEAGSASIVSMKTFNIGTVDMGARTTSMSVFGGGLIIYGDWSFGTGVITGSSLGITFAGQGTTTITSNGVEFSLPVTFDCGTGTVQLADAFAMPTTRTLLLLNGTFDAVSYNVTAGKFDGGTAGIKTLKMGSGDWTLTSTGALFSLSTTNTVLYKGTADILLSNTTTSARTFTGSGFSYNKLTIGGATGTSTLTITSNNQFTELASTKTVAHTIALGSTTQTFGKWSVTGTSGNVVTVTGTGNSRINGSRVSGVDYLAMGTTKLVTTGLLASPAEFYAGANSTGTGDGIILEDAPTPVTRYWVGGTGTWNATTTNWSATSGGAGGASVPTSVDAVIFDSASNATSYTVPISTVPARCGTLTVDGPASGTVTLGSSTNNPFFIHDNITFAATGLASLFNMSGGIVLSGSAAGRTITTNGVTITANAGNPTVDGVGSSWVLGGAANFGTNAGLTLKAGSLSTANYSVQLPSMVLSGTGATSLSLGSSTVTMSGSSNAINFGSTESNKVGFTFDAGTSSINISVVNMVINGNGHTFYNVAETGVNTLSATINGTNTFNNLSFAGRTSGGISNRVFGGNQTINGTLTLSAGTDATMRTFVRSSAIGTTRTLTCAAVDALTDIDFRDITIAGAAVSGGNLTGTRLGECGGNSGITFDAGVNKYWNRATSSNWSATAWALSSGGAVSNDNFPLAQDTCIFEAGSPNSGVPVTVDAAYNIGTIDMSARTTNTMTLATGTQTPSIYGNWTNGTGVTLSGTATLTFAGRGSQTLTSAGRTFTQAFTIDTPGGSVTLQDAFETNRSSAAALTLNAGTFDANDYNVTLSDGAFSSANTNTRTVAIGSGTWTVVRSSTAWNTSSANNLTITGTGTISFTSASAKTFAVGTADYSSITANQGGAGTLTINSIGSLANITNTYSATGATTLNFGTTTQRVADFTATGTAGNVLTIQGSSATSPCNLIHTGAGDISLDYLNLIGVRAYQI